MHVLKISIKFVLNDYKCKILFFYSTSADLAMVKLFGLSFFSERFPEMAWLVFTLPYAINTYVSKFNYLKNPRFYKEIHMLL